jgi:pantoate--beta-alanine ligase
MKELIEKEPLAKIDYLKAVDAMSMIQVEKLDRTVLFAMAVFIGKTRLIDNFTFNFEDVITQTYNKQSEDY